MQELVQPHDVLGQKVAGKLPKEKQLADMMRRSYEILVNHPVNLERKKRGERPANSCWFWGAGTKPSLYPFEERSHKKGAMISAVDLLKGIAVGTSMKVITVEGANGGLDTNYEGKAQAAVEVLTKGGCDFVYVHLEGPDEMGHQGSVEKKITAIERLDERIIRPIAEGLKAAGEEFRMAILPDHPTPIEIRTHSADDVPYLLYDSTRPYGGEGGEKRHYNEREAAATGRRIETGHELLDHLLAGR